MSFEVRVPGYRLVETRRGDDLRRLAARELGDAARWVEIIYLNGLLAPYLTDDPDQAGDGVLLTGSAIKIPARTTYVPAHIDSAAVYGRDCVLRSGDLGVTESGDIETVEGAPNLEQAIRHVIATSPGDLVHHPRYGCGVHAMVGRGAGPQTAQIADGLVRRSVLADERIEAIRDSTTEITGDTLRIALTAEAIFGKTVTVNGISG